MIITDLDGTIVRRDGSISAEDLATLKAAGEKNIPRVAATGRSLLGAKKVVSPDFPIDYLIFSSGAGIVDWRTGEFLVSYGMRPEQTARAADILIGHGVDFMLHDPVPENHGFFYYKSGNWNPDFLRRLERNSLHSRPWDSTAKALAASQFLVVDRTPNSGVLFGELKTKLFGFNLIRATSPLDHESAWIEIFPESVSKALASAFLAERIGVAQKDVLAVGNDYNDIDLLHWAGTPFIVADAPAEIRTLFPNVGPHVRSGFSEAVAKWLAAY